MKKVGAKIQNSIDAGILILLVNLCAQKCLIAIEHRFF